MRGKGLSRGCWDLDRRGWRLLEPRVGQSSGGKGGEWACRSSCMPSQQTSVAGRAALRRGSCQTIECCRYLTGSEWVTGSNGGMLELWSSMKKKPMQRLFGAHGAGALGVGEEGAGAGGVRGAGSVGGDAASWVGAVGSCRGSDLVVSPAWVVLVEKCSPGAGPGAWCSSAASTPGIPSRPAVQPLCRPAMQPPRPIPHQPAPNRPPPCRRPRRPAARATE
jgi:hypothetical protein